MSTTTPTITSSGRRREAVCPPWCLGHDDDGYQPWETRTADGVRERSHCDYGTIIGGVYVGLSQTENEATGMQPARVEVTADDMNLFHELNEVEAHDLGMALCRASNLLWRERYAAEDREAGR